MTDDDTQTDLVNLLRYKYKSLDVGEEETVTAARGILLHLHKSSKSRLTVVDGDHKAAISAAQVEGTVKDILARHNLMETHRGNCTAEFTAEHAAVSTRDATTTLAAITSRIIQDCDWRGVQNVSHAFLRSSGCNHNVERYVDTVVRTTDPVVYGSKEELHERMQAIFAHKYAEIHERHNALDDMIKQHKKNIQHFCTELNYVTDAGTTDAGMTEVDPAFDM